VGFQFEIDANGILIVLVRDIKTGNQKIEKLKSAVDVKDEDVERMVAESVEHAFDDLAQRLWIEAKRQSGDLLTGTRKALAQVGHLIVEDEVAEIHSHISLVEKALESENLAELKAANAALDKATVPLADLLMDMALEEQMKRKGLLDEPNQPSVPAQIPLKADIAQSGLEGQLPLKGEDGSTKKD
jgi:molecular chaperone DnaK